MDIKEIALKVGLQVFEEHPYDDGHVVSPSGYTWIDDKLIEFAEAIIESYKAELLKEVTSKDVLEEPVAYFSDEFFSVNTKQNATFNDPLFSSDQVAAAVARATKPLEEKLTKAEQRVAEACASFSEDCYEGELGVRIGKEIADDLRQGEWRKFMKEFKK